MIDAQGWIDGLHPMAAFLVMGGLFLVVGIAGWYSANATSFLWRRWRKSTS